MRTSAWGRAVRAMYTRARVGPPRSGSRFLSRSRLSFRRAAAQLVGGAARLSPVEPSANAPATASRHSSRRARPVAIDAGTAVLGAPTHGKPHDQAWTRRPQTQQTAPRGRLPLVCTVKPPLCWSRARSAAWSLRSIAATPRAVSRRRQRKHSLESSAAPRARAVLAAGDDVPGVARATTTTTAGSLSEQRHRVGELAPLGPPLRSCARTPVGASGKLGDELLRAPGLCTRRQAVGLTSSCRPHTGEPRRTRPKA